VEDPVTHQERKIQGGAAVTAFLQQQNVTSSNVLSVDLYFISSKTSKKVTTIVKHPAHLARRSTIESMMLDDLVDWMRYSGVKSDDELLTPRYNTQNRRKVVIRKDIRTAIITAVQSMGLPRELFSNKSLRSGFSSHVIANGMGEAEMKRGGGWTENSTVPNNHYTHQMRDRGALALTTSGKGTQCLNVHDIKRMLPAAAEELDSGDANLGGTRSCC
jgi:hypothetical protein